MPRLSSKTPHVNFEVKSARNKSGTWSSVVTVSNAGDEPAYNLFVHYFEQFIGENFILRASDAKNEISRAVLGIRDSLEFKIDGVQFVGCSATSQQEIWIEYENSAGVNFRVVSIPTTPRGDNASIKPPEIIRRRLERMPGATINGNKKLANAIKNGKKSYLPKVKKREIMKYNLYKKPVWKFKDWYNRLRYERR